MRILHLVNHCMHGGNVIVPVDLACMQAADAHDVVYASAGGRYEQLLCVSGARHVTLQQSLRNPLQATASVTSLYRLCREFRPSILHAHMMSGAVIGYAVSRLLHLPLVTTVHNSFDSHSRFMRLGDQVVAVSHAEARLLKAQGYDPRRLHVILNGTIGSPRESAMAENSTLSIQRPCIVTACGLEMRKGVDTLIEAFHILGAKADHWHLYIAGDGPERRKLEALAGGRGLTRRIHFLGHLPSSRPLLDRADIFVLSSRMEPFGLSMAEARSAGCAVVGTNVGGIPEVMDHGIAGILVPPDEPSSLAEALLELVRNPAALLAARQRSKANINRFNLKRVAEEYMRVYEYSIARRTKPNGKATAAKLGMSRNTQ